MITDQGGWNTVGASPPAKPSHAIQCRLARHRIGRGAGGTRRWTDCCRQHGSMRSAVQTQRTGMASGTQHRETSLPLQLAPASHPLSVCLQNTTLGVQRSVQRSVQCPAQCPLPLAAGPALLAPSVAALHPPGALASPYSDATTQVALLHESRGARAWPSWAFGGLSLGLSPARVRRSCAWQLPRMRPRRRPLSQTSPLARPACLHPCAIVLGRPLSAPGRAGGLPRAAARLSASTGRREDCRPLATLISVSLFLFPFCVLRFSCLVTFLALGGATHRPLCI